MKRWELALVFIASSLVVLFFLGNLSHQYMKNRITAIVTVENLGEIVSALGRFYNNSDVGQYPASPKDLNPDFPDRSGTGSAFVVL